MSKLNFTYYKNLGEIKMTAKDINNNYCDVCFNVADRTTFEDYKTVADCSKKIAIQNFEVSITEADNKFPPIKYPQTGVTFISTDQFFLFNERLYWKSECDELNFIVKIGKLEKKFTYKVPIPEQPYPSWIWKNNQWNAPVAYPDVDKDYIWNEKNLNWELE